MKKQTMTLAGIPAILYGSRSRNVYLYLHGASQGGFWGAL